MMDINIFIGTAGMVLLLLGFSLNELKIMTPDSASYNLMNIIGAGLLMYYAWTLLSIPFIILEGFWAVFAVYKLIIVLKK